jgi:putative ABC transport system ATP-binding protein
MNGRILCEGLVKIYKSAETEVVALQGLDLLVEPGELVAIVGASGSGKSTLQNILAGLDSPTAGRVEVAGRDLTRLTPAQRRAYRLSIVGFVWQETARNLVPYLTVEENVALPLMLSGRGRVEREERAAALVALVGMEGHEATRADALSGGEQQRVAVAAALANGPAVLLADEPTGELDADSSEELFGVLQRVSASGVTVVVVTHDPLVSGAVGRTIAIRDGRTSTETVRATAGGSAEEFALVDGAGRVQLPAAYVETLGLGRRVRLVLERDRIEIRSDR